MTPWSYTSLRDFENCPRAYHHKRVLKDVPVQESEAMKWGVNVHEAMEKRLRDGTPLLDGMRTYEAFVPPKSGLLRGLVEYKLGIREDGSPCGFFDDDCWGRGKLDFALVDHDAHTACVVDWKTGRVSEIPDELEIFALLLHAKYPALEQITGWYVWLKEGRLGRLHDLSDTGAKLRVMQIRVGQLKHAETMDSFPPRQSGLCPYCPVNKTQCEFKP